jgi:hypothetical protein
LTAAAFLVMGYHPGLEDDAFYLAAIKRNLNPALFPHDADFFRLQFQATIFDKLVALSVRLTRLPIAWTELLWQWAAIFFLLQGCWRIVRRCFSGSSAQWVAVALVAVLLTLPVSGTGIYLADPYLHPRTLATAAIVAALVEVIDRRFWRAGVLLAIAFCIHAIMASFGISLSAFLWWTMRKPTPQPDSQANVVLLPIAVAFPLGWIFEPSSDAWRQAAATRSFYFLAHWQWYEWLGIFAPLALLFGLRLFLQSHRRATPECPVRASALLPLLSALIHYGVFQTVVGLLVMLPPSLERLRPFEPMRYLQLLYLLFVLIVGGLLGEFLERKAAQSRDLPSHSPLVTGRWPLLLFIPLAAGMFDAQRQMFPATAHIEWPGGMSQNAWLQAFGWIRQNTPVDSLFALDPHYVELPGEDYHGFRALAERSALADYVKDGGMAARVPRLAPRWLKEVTAQSGWQDFRPADFARLQHDFGVNWVIISHDARDPGPSRSYPGLTCVYRNQLVYVCRLY